MILSSCSHGNIIADWDKLTQVAPVKTILLYAKYEEAQNSLPTVQQQQKEERPDVEDLIPNAAGRALCKKSQVAVSHQIAPSKKQRIRPSETSQVTIWQQTQRNKLESSNNIVSGAPSYREISMSGSTALHSWAQEKPPGALNDSRSPGGDDGTVSARAATGEVQSITACSDRAM